VVVAAAPVEYTGPDLSMFCPQICNIEWARLPLQMLILRNLKDVKAVVRIILYTNNYNFISSIYTCF